ncbi:MAG: DUF4062 domain-containing protein, partial [Pyrinomonadaceae bacterium]|nr:DUF4062 domain-containing protein [Pyrinomonadaceae bacterium]
MAKIYISSTYGDLKEFREEAYRALRQLRHDVVAMEDYAASDQRPLDVCLADVASCDIYVGIFAWRYGFIPPKDNPERRSITELEFRRAAASGKTCLIFLLHEDVPWPPSLMEKGEGGEKLQQLRAELMDKHSVDFFRNKDDLARRVSAAVQTIVVGGPRVEPQRRRETINTGPLNLGPLVAKMCDRRQQENEFFEVFTLNLRARPGLPQVYLIRGEEGECHDSLVERLMSTRMKQIAEKKWGAQGSVIIFKTPAWPMEGELIERQQNLQRNLFAEFDPAYMEDDLSATALSRLPILQLTPLVVIRHRIHAARWDRPTRELVEWYMAYWSALKVEQTGPQFLIFLNVIYPRIKMQPAGWWKTLLRPRQFDKRRVESDLQEIAAGQRAGLPFLLLKELLPVTQVEVKDWFSQYNIYDEKKRNELAERIFTARNGRLTSYRSMADIEYELR